MGGCPLWSHLGQNACSWVSENTEFLGKLTTVPRQGAERVDLASKYVFFCETNGIFIFRFLRWSYFRVSSLLFSKLTSPPSYLCWAQASFLHSGAKIRSKYWQNMSFYCGSDKEQHETEIDFIAPPTTSTPTRLPQYLLINFTWYKFLVLFLLPMGLPHRADCSLVCPSGAPQSCAVVAYVYVYLDRPILIDWSMGIPLALANSFCFSK